MPSLLFVLALAAPKPATLHARAVDAFKRADYRRAAELLSQDVVSQDGTALEQQTREMLVLAYYNANKRDEAKEAFRALLRKFPDFHFNDDEVLPEVIAFFETERPPPPPPAPAPEPVTSEPAPIVAAPVASAPVAIKEAPPAEPAVATKKPWRAYYLVPLGIGQYLAGSPVRGTLLLVAQLGFVALNVASAFMYGAQLYPEGNARSLTQAQLWQTMTNVGFGGIVGSVLLGALDGIFLEP